MAAAASEPVSRVEHAGGVVSICSRAGEMFLQQQGSVFFIASNGRLSLEGASELLAVLTTMVSAHANPLLVSYSPMLTGIDPDAREKLGEWARANGQDVRSILLLRSKIVRMAISVLAMLGRSSIETYDDEALFHKGVAASLPPGVRDPHLERRLAQR